jgi:hypothetical protein
MLHSHRILAALPLMIFIVTLLLFPAAHGSFAATHGPVTALRAVQAAALLLLALTCLQLLGRCVFARLLQVSIVDDSAIPFASHDRNCICSLLC